MSGENSSDHFTKKEHLLLPAGQEEALLLPRPGAKRNDRWVANGGGGGGGGGVATTPPIAVRPMGRTVLARYT